MKKLLYIVPLLLGMALTSCYDEDIENINSRLDAIENTQIATISQQITSINNSIQLLTDTDTELKGYIATLEKDVEQSKADIETLKAKDSAIEKLIAELRSYVDSELKSAQDWATATFATLEQHNALATELASLKTYVEGVESSLNNAISALKTSMKEWVNEQLTGYYTIAEIDAKLKALETATTEGDEALQKEIDALKEQLAAQKTELTEAYSKAIEEAINTNNGVIEGKIAEAIGKVNEQIAGLEERINTLEERITKLEGTMSEVQEQVTALVFRIQSISYVPQYSDGKANIDKDKKIGVFDYQISPKEAVADLANVWQRALTVQAVHTQTRVPSFIELSVIYFEADVDNGTFTVEVDASNLGDDFFVGNVEASMAIHISDGNNDRSSDYINLILGVVDSDKEIGGYNTLAFPGAEGGGMYTTGGRGGKVYHVTNLNDSGAGSFREAVGKSGARTIVFDVAGTIHLKSTLRITNGNLTIAGQTAPGDGICIAGRTVQVSASNIIIRYIRFRLGNEDKSQEDAIWGRYNSDIILDHCSMSWSVDEACSFYANKNFTMQWCVVSEALKNAGHTKGAHGYGGIWGGRNASFHHNLLAHNDSRNPRFDHPEVYDSYVNTHRGNADYRNNVVYNWGGNSTYGGEGAAWNVVGNYYKPGPASKQKKYFVDANGIYSSSNKDYGYAKMYVSGNYHAGSYAASINSDNWSGIYLHDGTKPSNHNSWKSTAQLPIRKDDSQQCYTTTHTAQQAYEQVLAYVGASLPRDAVDSRVVGEVKNGNYTHKGSNGGTNGIIDSHTDVGGWPTLSATSAEVAKVKDTDGDGMPDSWESAKGLNPNSPTDGTTNTLNPSEGYTNLEIYLAELVENITNNQNQKGTYTTLN